MNKASELSSLYQKYNDRVSTILSVGGDSGDFRAEVKYRITSDDMANIVDSVCHGVVDSESGSYRPELKDYFIRAAILETYAGIALPGGAERWDAVYGIPLFAMITGHELRPIMFNNRSYDENTLIDT